MVHRGVAPFAFFLLLASAVMRSDSAAPHRATLVVSNPIALARPEEILEIPLAQIRSQLGVLDPKFIAVEDLTNHKTLPVQMDNPVSGAASDRLLVLVGLGFRQTIRLEFRTVDEPPAAKPLVFGRMVPERKDDFAWENDKVAYRVYGPALQATAEVTSGIDVWSKRVPDLVVNAWYSRDAESQRMHDPALSYHHDSGQGLDSYEVGSTRGCGGTGLWKDGRLRVSKNYVSAEILTKGPIRLRFRLRYAPWAADGKEVSEEKVITLDAGSHLNRVESKLTFSGNLAAQWAAGLAMHAGAHLNAAPASGILAVWEPLSTPTAGMEGTGIVLEPGKTAHVVKAAGNAVLLRPAMMGVPMVYYTGAAWSKADIPDEGAWNRYLDAFRECLKHPLKTRWE